MQCNSRRASGGIKDAELRRRESLNGKRNTFRCGSYDSPGSLSFLSPPRCSRSSSHRSSSYTGSISLSHDESSITVFEVSDQLTSWLPVVVFQTRTGSPNPFLVSQIHLTTIPVQADDVCDGGVEEKKRVRQNSFSQEQQLCDGNDIDISKATSLTKPSKSSIPSQQTNGCCGNFGGDLRQGGLWWTSGYCSIVGRREKQEDRYCVIPRYDELIGNCEGIAREWTRAGFFGIYDGHCGAEAAQFVADELHTSLAHKVRMDMEPKMAVTETFLELDSQVRHTCGGVTRFDKI